MDKLKSCVGSHCGVCSSVHVVSACGHQNDAHAMYVHVHVHIHVHVVHVPLTCTCMKGLTHFCCIVLCLWFANVFSVIPSLGP